VNSESMRIDNCLSSTLFFSTHLIEFETCRTIKKLSLQLVLEPSMW